MYEALTERQQRIVAVIRDARAGGLGPTYRDIAKAVGIALATVTKEVEALKAMGVVRHEDGRRRALELVREPPPVSVPLVGRIAAGRPITAEEHVRDRLALPRELVGGGELFLLEVLGDSMTGAGVLDGDYVVVRRQPVAEHGEMVAALLEGPLPEATVKVWSLEGGRVRLRPANPAHDPIDGSTATVLGKVVAVLRRVR